MKIVLLSKLKLSRCLAPHLMAVLIGLLNTWSVLIVPNKNIPNPEAVFSNNPKISSIGNNIITANTLKKSWTVAAAKARLNSFPRFICPMETMIF